MKGKEIRGRGGEGSGKGRERRNFGPHFFAGAHTQKLNITRACFYL
jgi:hypothetical protein